MIELTIGGNTIRPEHLSKGEGYQLSPGDKVQVRTPGGGGYGRPEERAPDLLARDLRRGYYRTEDLKRAYGYVPG